MSTSHNCTKRSKCFASECTLSKNLGVSSGSISSRSIRRCVLHISVSDQVTESIIPREPSLDRSRISRPLRRPSLRVGNIFGQRGRRKRPTRDQLSTLSSFSRSSSTSRSSWIKSCPTIMSGSLVAMRPGKRQCQLQLPNKLETTHRVAPSKVPFHQRHI